MVNPLKLKKREKFRESHQNNLSWVKFGLSENKSNFSIFIGGFPCKPAELKLLQKILSKNLVKKYLQKISPKSVVKKFIEKKLSGSPAI